MCPRSGSRAAPSTRSAAADSSTTRPSPGRTPPAASPAGTATPGKPTPSRSKAPGDAHRVPARPWRTPTVSTQVEMLENLTVSELAEALRARARRSEPEKAAVDLLIWHEGWLGRLDFRRHCVTLAVAPTYDADT